MDRVLGCYREALRLRPDYVEVHNDLGNLHAERGDLDAADRQLSTGRRASGPTTPRRTSTWA